MSTIHQNRITKRVSFFFANPIYSSFPVKPRYNVNNGNSQAVGIWIVLTVVPTTYILVRICNAINNIFHNQHVQQTDCLCCLSYLKIISFPRSSGGPVVTYRCSIKWEHGSNPEVDQFISRVQCFAFYFLKHNSHPTNEHSHSFCTCFCQKEKF